MNVPKRVRLRVEMSECCPNSCASQWLDDSGVRCPLEEGALRRSPPPRGSFYLCKETVGSVHRGRDQGRTPQHARGGSAGRNTEGNDSMPRRPGERYLKARQRESKKSRDKAYDSSRKSPARRGYDKRWVHVRRLKLRRDPLCEMCQEEGLVTEATEVHHIIPISEGGDPYSMKNLMSLCHRCHMRIHAGEGEVKSL